jgi:hypothetical protein
MEWRPSEWIWLDWDVCECKSNGVRMKRLEWNEVDVNVSPMEWKWKILVKRGGCGCKFSGMRVNDLNAMRWMWVQV